MTDCPDCTRYEATLEFISYLTNEIEWKKEFANELLQEIGKLTNEALKERKQHDV